jgi:hypothetical protein
MGLANLQMVYLLAYLLDTFPKFIHGMELYCARCSLRCKSEVHGGPQVLNVDQCSNLDGLFARSLLAKRSVLAKKMQTGRVTFNCQVIRRNIKGQFWLRLASR